MLFIIRMLFNRTPQVACTKCGTMMGKVAAGKPQICHACCEKAKHEREEERKEDTKPWF
jgi:hypothetical protein